MGILSAIVWAPLVGLVVILVLPKDKTAAIRGVALAAAGVSFVLSWSLLGSFDRGNAELQFGERLQWIPELGMTYVLGVDGLSFPLMLLTTLLVLVSLIASLGIEERVKGYFAWFMILEFAILGVFAAHDWFLFYVFWEVGLVPMFFLIGLWGGERRDVATMSFFLYTLGGSIFMLLGIIAVYLNADPHSFDMIELAQESRGWTAAMQVGPFIAFFLGFAVKIPIFPLHGWLPVTHVEAPTPMSMILSGILLKMGGYGLMRMGELLPLGMERLVPVLMALGLVNILYGALLAWRQTDLKSMVAFSSISHMGFVLIGIASLNATGYSGAVFQMVAHGIITGGLFLLVGVIYERSHTRDITEFGGLGTRLPIFSAFMTLAVLASMGLPGLAQFVGEFHALVGSFQRWGFYVVIALLGILVTAAYSLRAIGRMMMGPFNPKWSELTDMRGTEVAAALPLAVFTIVLGLYPSLVLSLMDTTLREMTEIFG